eukprot:7620375-Pyramimonas_sp.AAC.1
MMLMMTMIAMMVTMVMLMMTMNMMTMMMVIRGGGKGQREEEHGTLTLQNEDPTPQDGWGNMFVKFASGSPHLTSIRPRLPDLQHVPSTSLYPIIRAARHPSPNPTSPRG